ncbi:MAG: ABC transporter ATP-binding protein [Syntrophomonadaceae bacterium]|nr:ABC transporter ATP-binding protein [Syntrophomonadaceae bacterium]MDD3023381.1 ABC transporter ATP-binding protein [Syntrophomonadaceae bacterium]
MCKAINQINQTILNVEGLWAGYKSEAAVRDLSLQIGAGEILGLIGPNGAGKSTSIKAILGLIEKSHGQVMLPIHKAGGYAYIPELPALYEELTLWEHMEIVAMAHGMEEKAFIKQGESLLRQFNMEDSRYSFPGGFSKGMRQKVMILCACLVKPALYLVDEPFNGLDPFAVKELLDLFIAEKARGAAILLSTHVLDIAERICDRFVLINQGQKIAEGSMLELRDQLEESGVSTKDLFDIFYSLMRG